MLSIKVTKFGDFRPPNEDFHELVNVFRDFLKMDKKALAKFINFF